MTSSQESKTFLSKIICARVVKSFSISGSLQTRLLFLCFAIIPVAISICFLIFNEDLYRLLKSVIKDCDTPKCLTNRVIHALMLSSSLFYVAILLITKLRTQYSVRCYKNCWIFKLALLLSFGILLISASLIVVSNIKDFFFWPSFAIAIGFIAVLCKYLVELAYDWNDTWYENYTENFSNFWAIMLIFTSILCWASNCFLLYLSYSSPYFLYILFYFFSSLILTGLSSSSICENGSLLSCSVTVSLGLYHLYSGIIYTGAEYPTIFSFFDTSLSFLATSYMIFTIDEKVAKPEHTQISVTELKSFKELEESKIEETDQMEIKKLVNYKFLVYLAMLSTHLEMIITGWGLEKLWWGRYIVCCGQSIGLFIFYVWTLVVPVVLPGGEDNS